MFGAACVHAQARIGFVNTERIFNESETAKRAQKKLEASFRVVKVKSPTLRHACARRVSDSRRTSRY